MIHSRMIDIYNFILKKLFINKSLFYIKFKNKIKLEK